MQSTHFLPSTPRLPKTLYTINPSTNIQRGVLINAKQGESEGKSNINEDNMIVLKMRIKKMKVLSGGSNKRGAAPPSSDWKEWEKRLFTHYHENVCDSIELLQSYLMNTRPSVALGTVVLIAMSVPLSTSMVMVNALKVAKGLLAGCHVCIDIDY